MTQLNPESERRRKHIVGQPPGTAGLRRSSPSHIPPPLLGCLSWVLPVLLFLWAGPAEAAPYWLRLARLSTPEQARAKAALVQKDWTRGGRLLRVMVHGWSQASGTAPEKQRFFDVLVGPFDSLPAAVIASHRFQNRQPWLDKGWALDRVPPVISGLFVAAPVRFTAKLAKACRALLSRPTSTLKDRPRDRVSGENIPQEKELPAPRLPGTAKPASRQAPPPHPLLAEALVARGFGYAAPRPYAPPEEQAVASFKAWDRLLVWDRREVCQKTPKVIGGPRPHLGPGPKDMTPQVHAGGKRCLEWVSALTPDMRLAWFPATQLAVSSRFKKATLTTRWGPVRIRYALVRVGRSPRGIIYQVVIRSGGFPPVRKTLVVPSKYPPPHRMGFDRLGAAIFEGRGLILRRITVTPPSPPVPALWKMRRFKNYLTYHPN